MTQLTFLLIYIKPWLSFHWKQVIMKKKYRIKIMKWKNLFVLKKCFKMLSFLSFLLFLFSFFILGNDPLMILNQYPCSVQKKRERLRYIVLFFSFFFKESFYFSFLSYLYNFIGMILILFIFDVFLIFFSVFCNLLHTHYVYEVN